MSPIKLEQQHDINRKENELEEPLALDSISNNAKATYYDLELHHRSNLPDVDDSNHPGQSFFTTRVGQYKLVLTCAAFSALFLSAGFLINQILKASIFLPTKINNSNVSELIEIINTWETDIFSPQYLWLSAQNLQQDGHLQRSIHLLKLIPENSELYAVAQAEILALQEEIWQMAQARYQAGKQDEAVMIAESIQPNSPYYEVANNSVFEWKQAWETDKPKAEQIIALAESTKWDDWMTVRSLYNELINPYWQNETVSIYQNIEERIKAEQERQRQAEQQKPAPSEGNTTPRSTTPIRNTTPRSAMPRSIVPNGPMGERVGPSTSRPSNSDPFTSSGQPPVGSTTSGGGHIKSEHIETIINRGGDVSSEHIKTLINH